jgi:uroporphyrinogen-III synthase
MPALEGRTLVITRPLAQAESLNAAIAARGGQTLCFPVLEIVALADQSGFAAFAARLAQFDLAFFVSPNAVQYGLAGLTAHCPWPTGLKVATVGKGSAQALAAHGFREVIAPDDGFDSEAVLALPDFSAEAVRGRAVLILRGNGGRELLGDTLAARGARVEYLACYQRRCPDADPQILLAPLARGRVDALSLTSSEGVDNLARMLGAEGLPQLANLPVFAPHPRIAARCRAHGLRQIVDIGGGDDALIRALLAYFG